MTDIGEQNNSVNGGLKETKTIIGLFENYAEDIYSLNEEERKMAREVTKQEDVFLNSLAEEKQKQYEKLWELKNKKNAKTDEKIFVYGFSLAIKLILEGTQLDTNIF